MMYVDVRKNCATPPHDQVCHYTRNNSTGLPPH